MFFLAMDPPRHDKHAFVGIPGLHTAEGAMQLEPSIREISPTDYHLTA